eukprot:6175848-Pleurochrysis_carterae.AAC.1
MYWVEQGCIAVNLPCCVKIVRRHGCLGVKSVDDLVPVLGRVLVFVRVCVRARVVTRVLVRVSRQVSLLKIREKELQFYTQNCIAIGTQAPDATWADDIL